MIDKLSYGVCFYPEHWPWKTVVDDIRRIRDCGFNYVRIGEGAWWYFEPEEGKYQFDLFDKVIDECRRAGLKVIFGTPTYCGPAWIGHKYPEVYRWDFQRTPMKHGSRRNYNYTSPKYLELSDRIVTALAQHYRREKQIIAWQIDNEFNCHMDVSYAPTDTLAFREWLRARYRTLEKLNDAWGTKFWSQVYSAWDQIDLPHPSATYNNPTQLLDETRFISDTVIAYYRRQADILRAANPKWPLTHNGVFGNIDGSELTKQLDFFSHDQYPMFWNHWTAFAQPLVQARSLSFPYAVLEQQSGPGGQMTYLLRTARDGEMRLWAHQSFAHGAKMLSYFCWRTCPFGTEQHWHGLLDHDGRDNSRIAAARQIGREINQLPAELWDAAPEKSFAVLRDFDNETNDRRINTYTKSGWEPGHWLTALFKAHIPVDEVWPVSDWAGYRVLIAPHLKIISRDLVARYTAFVEKGGTLIIGAQSATKDDNLHMRTQPRPALLRKLTGIEIADWSSLKPEESRDAQFENGDSITLVGFVERIKLRGALALAEWHTDDDLLSGAPMKSAPMRSAPAISVNTFGRGRVIYIGGHLAEAGCAAVLKWVLSELDISAPIEAGDEVELIVRRGKKHRYLWLLNHSTEPEVVNNVPAGRELLTDQPVKGTLKLPPRGVAIVMCK
ncbi:MAG: beta-galactosidase [Burkholderiales bacterium]|nr:beta-galactosidase [Phycisphaerae bacterium]